MNQTEINRLNALVDNISKPSKPTDYLIEPDPRISIKLENGFYANEIRNTDAQQAEIEALKAQLKLIQQKWSAAENDIASLFKHQEPSPHDGSYLVDGQSVTELAGAIVAIDKGGK